MRKPNLPTRLTALVIALVVLTYAAPLPAATYYVRKTGSDSNAGTTPTTAFLTIKKAATVAKNGDTVYVGSGAYADSVSVKNVNANTTPVRYYADTTGAMTGDAAGDVIVTSGAGLTVENSKAVEFYGFTLLGAIEWKGGSTLGLMQGCTRTNAGTTVLINQAGVTLRQCVITNSSVVGLTIDGSASSVSIEGCTVTYSNKHGIEMKKAALCTIQDSTIAYNREHGFTAKSDNVAHRLKIERCKVFGNNKDGIHFHDKINTEIHSTLVVRNSANGVNCHGNKQPITILNCTIADNGDDGYDFNGSSTTVKNTIFANNRGYGFNKRSGTVVREYNLYYGNGTTTGNEMADEDYSEEAEGTPISPGGPGEITGYPDFVSSEDYHLRAGSTAINRGTDAGVWLDLDGLDRYSFGDVDIGAYEFNAIRPAYYVRVNGNDNNSGRTRGRAWRTIRHAMATVPPGALVLIGAGTYQETAVFGASGSPDNPTIFEADTTGVRTGDAGAVTVVPAAAGGIACRMDGAQDVILRRMRFAGNAAPSYAVDLNQSSRVLFEDCIFEQLDRGVSATRSTVTFTGCQFHNNTERSVATSFGELVVQNCEFTGNRFGPYSDHDDALRIENSTINGQSDWAAVVIGPRSSLQTPGPTFARLINTTIDDNQNGVRLGNITQTEVAFSETVIRNSRAWALGLYDSVVTLDANTPQAWPLQNNNSGIFSYNTALTVNGYHVENYTSGYGLAGQLGTVAVNNSRVANNLYGLAMQNCTEFTAQNCDFNGNLEFGLVVTGKVNLQSCRFDANKNGIQLNQTDDTQVQLVNTTVSNSQQFGVQAIDSQLVFDASTAGKWQLSGNGHGIAGLRSNLTFNGFTLAGQVGAAVHSTNGRLIINNSTFSGNGMGVSSNQDTQFAATDSSFAGNNQWGAQLTGAGAFTRCRIADNQLGGLWLHGLTDGNLQLNETTLSDNGTYGVYAEQCRLTFDPGNIGQYVISGSDYAFAGNQSELVFDRVTITGGNIAAALATGGTLLASGATFSGSDYGLMVYDSSSFSAASTQFSDNRLYGLYIQGQGQLQDCTLATNGRGGLFLYRTRTGDVRLANTLISGNLEHGIRAEQCQMTIDDNFAAPWRVTGNPTAIYSSQSDLTLEGLALSESSGPAVRAVGGQLHVRNSTVSNNGGGVHCESVALLTVADSILSDNRGWAITANGPLNLVNSRVRNNTEGVWLGATSDDQLELASSQITDNENHGLYLHGCTLVFNPARQAGCVIERNGVGITAEQSQLTLTDYALRGNRYGLCSYASDVLLERARFAENEVGFYGSANNSLVVRSTTAEQNSSAGAHLASVAELSDSSFRNNGCGLILEGRTTGDVQFANCDVVANTGDGIRAVACTLALGSADQAGLRISGNGRGITSRDGTLSLDGYSVSGNTEYGVAVYSGTLQLANLSLNGNGSGLLLYRTQQASLGNAQLHGNQNWGLVAHALEDGALTATLDNCLIHQNGNGFYLAGATDGSVDLSAAAITDNGGYGLCVANSTLLLERPTASPWQIARNGISLGASESELSVAGLQLENSQLYGLLALHSTITMTQTGLSGSGSGIYSASSDLTVDRCRLQGAGGTEPWGVLSYNSRTTLRNSTVIGYANGIYVEAASTAEPAEVRNVTLAGAVRDGIYLNGGSLTVQNSIISGSSGRYGLARQTGNLSHSHNLVHGFTSPHHQTTPAPTELLKNPRFRDPDNGDYRLAVGSPAINAGADLRNLYQHDLEGAMRPTYQAFEMGAYEYVNPHGSLRVLSWSEQR